MDSTARRGNLPGRVPARLAGCAAALALAAACGRSGGGAPGPWRDQLHRRSALPGLGWELVPGADVQVDGVRVQVSSIGARDDEPVPGGDVFRVAALGGCLTFGRGVEVEASWPRLLERELDTSILVLGRKVDFLDLAVSGYGPAQQAAALEQRALGLDPWLVVLEHSFEDPASPHLVALRGLAGRPASPSLQELHDPDGAPWKQLSEAWTRVRTLSAQRNVPVVLVIVPRLDGTPWEAYPYRALHEQVAREGRRRSLEVLDLLETFELAAPQALVTAGDDPAPSARAQAIVADSVKRFLYSSGVLTRVLEAH